MEIRSLFSKRFAALRAQTASAPIACFIDTFTFNANTPSALKTLGAKLPKLWAHQNLALTEKQEQYVRNFEEKIVAYEGACRGVEDYYRLRAYSRALLRDTEMALTFARQAIEIAPASPVAAQLYASLLLNDHKNAEARDVLVPFIKDLLARIANGEDLLKTYGPTVVREIFSSFFKTFIWFNEFDEVMRLTEHWGRTPEFLRIIFAVSRCAALRRAVEREPRGSAGRCRALSECGRIVVYCYEGLNASVSVLDKEAVKVRKELSNRLDLVPLEFRQQFALVANAITDALEDGFPHVDVPLAQERKPMEADVVAMPKSAILTSIYSIKQTYCFAEDESGAQYFIPFSKFEHGRTPQRTGEKTYVWDLASAPGSSGATKAGYARLV